MFPSMKELVARHAKILKINSKAAEPSGISNGSRVFRILSHRTIGIGKQLPKVTRIRFWRPRTYITFRLRSVLNLGSVIISVCLSFLPLPHFISKNKNQQNAQQQRILLPYPQALCEVDASAGRDKVKKKSTMPATANSASNQLANSLGQFLVLLCKNIASPKNLTKMEYLHTNTYKYIQDLDGFGAIEIIFEFDIHIYILYYHYDITKPPCPQP